MNSSQGYSPRRSTKQMLSKVPEITIWFWIIKILCTTVGESFADWINMALGLGLTSTAVIFSGVMAIVLAMQLSLKRYVPGVYWLTVVVLSITGTLYTDILTDDLGVPLWVSSLVFSVILAVVFGYWFVKERTLSIHSITTTPREAYYWLAVLVTFALGTALGDRTLELTGWGPGVSILLPAALITIVTALWRFGANPVLSFWIAYILTRPLGANIGDWLGLPSDQQGLGLGTFVTSLIFLAAILATVIYLTMTKSDVLDSTSSAVPPATSPVRQRSTLVALGVVAAATVGLLTYANSQPHQSALADEGPAPSCSSGSSFTTADQARQAVIAHFPASDVSNFATITTEVLGLVQQGHQKEAASRITDLEMAWDSRQPDLYAADCQAWTFVDQKIDPVLTALRAASPDPLTEQSAIADLLAVLPGA